MQTEYSLENDKYTIIYKDGYPSKVLRYGTPWIDDLDNAHIWMAIEIDKLATELERAIDVIEASGVDYDEVMEGYQLDGILDNPPKATPELKALLSEK